MYMETRLRSSRYSHFGETDLFRNKSFGALTDFDHQFVAPTPKRTALQNLRLSGNVSPVPDGRCQLTQYMPDQAFFSNEIAVELFSILAKTGSAGSTPTSRLSPVSEASVDSLTRSANPMVRNASFDCSQSVPPSKHRRQVEKNKQVVAKVHAKTCVLIRKSRSMSWPAVRRSPSDGTNLPLLSGANVAAVSGF